MLLQKESQKESRNLQECLKCGRMTTKMELLTSNCKEKLRLPLSWSILNHKAHKENANYRTKKSLWYYEVTVIKKKERLNWRDSSKVWAHAIHTGDMGFIPATDRSDLWCMQNVSKVHRPCLSVILLGINKL